METVKIENFSFTYPDGEKKAIDGINLSVNPGEFVTVCGKSGCGKSTLLRNLKPSLAPLGERRGKIFLDAVDVSALSHREETTKIGFVMQNVDNQIVTDKVWHELAFGLESLGLKTPEIRAKVAEMAAFFGIEDWFLKNTCDLSGGQKQILNLASVMVMGPEILVLDEPTSQLDPISAIEFITMLSRINRQLGTTVILSEHRLEELFSISDRIIVMEDGKIIADDMPKRVCAILRDKKSDMMYALPTSARVYGALCEDDDFPIDTGAGKNWLMDYAKGKTVVPKKATPKTEGKEVAVELNDVYYRYERESRDVLKGVSLTAYRGEVYALLGSNGAGKSTILSLISGVIKPVNGRIQFDGNTVSALPQNPETVFLESTIYRDLYDTAYGTSDGTKEKRIFEVAKLCHIEGLLDRNPMDLSGGEKERAALAKILLVNSEVILLDEPTKGMDAGFKAEFRNILNSLKESGKTIIMVSHDIEFCAECAARCGLLFNGQIVSEGEPREFFGGKSFYTTAANKMSQGVLENAVLPVDIITAFGKNEKVFQNTANTEIMEIKKEEKNCDTQKEKKEALKRPKREKIGLSLLTVLLLIPATVLLGVYFPIDRKYYVISLLVILEIMLPFFARFEGKKPEARELVLIGVLTGIAVCGRSVFYMLPQFKPTLALIIIYGAALGGETGFLTGALYAFVSNFFFGQGPWTPWQMFATGIVGFLSGVLFYNRNLKNKTAALSVFGIISAIIIYGGIMNPASVIMYQPKPTLEMIVSAFALGVPYDMIYALSTVLFILIGAKPMLKKLDRVKTKYGFYR